MSYRAEPAIVVGVSYVELAEKDDFDIDEMEKVVGELGFSVYVRMPQLDVVADVFVGVIFTTDVPTDAQREEARQRVEAALPQLTEKLGPPSSDVDVWLLASVN